jgi:hypothetical protein
VQTPDKTILHMHGLFGGSELVLVSESLLFYLPDGGILMQLSTFRSQSQWPRGLRQEMSSPARTLGSWVRIPLEA